jgi:predicted transcriptional regulator
LRSFLINKEILEVNKITYEEFVMLLSVVEGFEYFDDTKILKSLEEKNFLKVRTNTVIIRDKTKKFLNSISKDVDIVGTKVEIITKRTQREVNDEVNERVQEYRNVFKGHKAGSMGSVTACKNNLSEFLKRNTQYNLDDVIKAAKLYINTVNDFTYLQRADYFIYKQDKNKNVTSTLEAFIDEEADETNKEWTTNLK